MANLTFLVNLLEAAEASEKVADNDAIDPKCLCASRRIMAAREEYADAVEQQLILAMANAWEVQNYPEIATHLASVVKVKILRSVNLFIDISGIRIKESDCTLQAARSDLSSLGDHEDWESMQDYASKIIPPVEGEYARTSDTPRTKEQAPGGWRNYYTRYVHGVQRSWVYPAIMQARLTWAKSNELAPYWYWYEQEISTSRAYPRQQVIGLRDAITEITEQFMDRVNDSCASGGYLEEPEVEIPFGELERQIEEIVDSYANERAPKEIDIKVTYGGRYNGRILNEREIIRLISSGEIVLSRSFPKGDTMKLNFQVAANRRFTGLYARLKKI